jgi:hypothetical protein
MCQGCVVGGREGDRMIVREEKCPECDGVGRKFVEQRGFTRVHEGCTPCQGSGTITTPLSTEEALELLGKVIEIINMNEEADTIQFRRISWLLEGVKVTG